MLYLCARQKRNAATLRDKQVCPDGGIGRHEGLKIPWPKRPCGFDPRLGYQKEQIRIAKWLTNSHLAISLFLYIPHIFPTSAIFLAKTRLFPHFFQFANLR